MIVTLEIRVILRESRRYIEIELVEILSNSFYYHHLNESLTLFAVRNWDTFYLFLLYLFCSNSRAENEQSLKLCQFPSEASVHLLFRFAIVMPSSWCHFWCHISTKVFVSYRFSRKIFTIILILLKVCRGINIRHGCPL